MAHEKIPKEGSHQSHGPAPREGHPSALKMPPWVSDQEDPPGVGVISPWPPVSAMPSLPDIPELVPGHMVREGPHCEPGRTASRKEEEEGMWENCLGQMCHSPCRHCCHHTTCGHGLSLRMRPKAPG